MHRAVLKVGITPVQLTPENIEFQTKALAGTFKDGILEFTAGPEQTGWYAILGDWILIYDTGRIKVLSDEEFSELYDLVLDDTISVGDLPDEAPSRNNPWSPPTE